MGSGYNVMLPQFYDFHSARRWAALREVVGAEAEDVRARVWRGVVGRDAVAAPTARASYSLSIVSTFLPILKCVTNRKKRIREKFSAA